MSFPHSSRTPTASRLAATSGSWTVPPSATRSARSSPGRTFGCSSTSPAQSADGATLEADGDLLAVLTAEFAERLEAVSRTGLVAGYGEASTVSPFLRGKLRTADQMRDAAATAFPDRFHIDEPVFDLHTPWNRIPKATATALLRHELPTAVRQRVEAAVLPLAVLPDEPATDADFAAAIRGAACGRLPAASGVVPPPPERSHLLPTRSEPAPGRSWSIWDTFSSGI